MPSDWGRLWSLVPDPSSGFAQPFKILISLFTASSSFMHTSNMIIFNPQFQFFYYQWSLHELLHLSSNQRQLHDSLIINTDSTQDPRIQKSLPSTNPQITYSIHPRYRESERPQRRARISEFISSKAVQANISLLHSTI